MKKYEVRKDVPKEIAEELAEYSPVLQKLLYHRGIDTAEKAHAFFNLDWETQNNNPYTMKDMQKAVDRIIKAVRAGEKILIFSDYDADGIPGAVILNDFFKKIGYENLEVYIPHRNEEGFGLNMDAIDKFIDEKVDLMITIDCGITDVAEVDAATKAGIDVIITDHHEVHENVPKAYAILNPKQPECEYPEKMICGAAVAFKLVEALSQSGAFELQPGFEKWLLDMVGIATLSDMVPLTGENRLFAHYGLLVLRKTPRKGLLKIFANNRIDQKNINEKDVGFNITPKINAASRMGIPKEAFYLLSTDDDIEADLYANSLQKANNQRRGQVAAMVKEIHKKLKKKNGDAGSATEKGVIVTGNINWKPSLLGLAANKIMDEFNCPVFLWGRENGKSIKGSCRIPEPLSGIEIMKGAEHVLDVYGGHHGAGGFEVTESKIHELEDALNASFEKLNAENKDIVCVADLEVTPDDVTWNLYDSIRTMAPFGMGNDEPILLLRDVPVQIFSMGADGNHTRINMRRSDGQALSAIAFYNSPKDLGIDDDEIKKLTVVGSLETNEYNGKKELRLKLIDVLI